MSVCESSSSDIPPFAVCDARIFVRCGKRGSGPYRSMAIPAPDSICSVVSEQERVWHLDVDVVVPQPSDRAAPFQEQDTLDSECALDAVFTFPCGIPQGPFLCLYQHKEWWMRPTWCDSLADVPARTQMILWRDHDEWGVLIAACDDDARVDFYGDGCTPDPDTSHICGESAMRSSSGLHVTLSSNRTGRTEIAAIAVYAAFADNPYSAIHTCVNDAAHRLGIAMCEQRPLPEALSGFGWCTWDSLGRDVSEVAIIEKMEEFRAKHVPVSWVMIDDGWSYTDRDAETLIGLDADSERFPHGLAHTVNLLRERYGVRHVGVWGAFQGYWNGLDSDGTAVAQIGKEHLTVTSNGCLIPGPGRQQAEAFWTAWLSTLRRMGVDCVKIDSQSSTSVMTRGVESYGEATIGRHAALDWSVEAEMDGALINCMGMAPENYWHRPSSAVTRTSDDFLPRDPSSLAEHLMQNAYCALLLGELYRCDWDMFWSEHPHARTHALMRALSGGPVYCSDAVGCSDPSVLGPLMFLDGRVLHPDCAAVPVVNALLADPTSSNHAWCVAARSGDWHVLAFVGMNPNLVQSIHLRDALHGLSSTFAAEQAQDCWWVVDPIEYKAYYVSDVCQTSASDSSPTLPYGESRLYYALPISIMPNEQGRKGCPIHLASPNDASWSKRFGIVPVGLIDKYLAPAGIVQTQAIPGRSETGMGSTARILPESGESCLSCALAVTLAEPGVFAFLDPDWRCRGVLAGGMPVRLERCGALAVVDCSSVDVVLLVGK